MRLAPVREQDERLAVVNQGLGIAPVEFLGEGDRRPLTEAYHIFRRLELPASSLGDLDRLSAAFSAWKEALVLSGIELRLERHALYGMPLPRTAWQADTRGISLRPWDVELTAIEANLRRVVKLDQVPPSFVDTLQDNAEQRGLLVEIVTPQHTGDDASESAGRVTLLVAHDAATLVEARELEQVLLVRLGAPGAAAAAAQMGELLGYPHCCAERFARVAAHNDTTLAWALLPGLCAPASPLTQWLQPGLALLSHSPCALSCVASIDLGKRLLDALEVKEPGFAARWRSLAARVQVVDQRGNRLALAVDGTLDVGRTIVAADLLGASGPDPDAAERARSVVGREVCPDSGGLVIADCDWYAAYVADHRGEP